MLEPVKGFFPNLFFSPFFSPFSLFFFSPFSRIQRLFIIPFQRMVHKFAVKGCWAESTTGVESEIPAKLFCFPKSLGGAGLMDVKCQVTALQASLVGDLHANLSLEPERQPKWVQYGTKPDKNYNEPGLMSIV